MNKILSQAIKKAVSEFSPNINNNEIPKRPDLFSLNNETELFQNSKGITIALSKRPTAKISGNIDYTYSISEGNASDPAAAFLDEQSNVEPEKMLVPLDWDQRHTFNTSLTYHPVKNSGIGLIFSFGSGFPYTTAYLGVRTSFENNAREPSTYNLDMRSYYPVSYTHLTLPTKA